MIMPETFGARVWWHWGKGGTCLRVLRCSRRQAPTLQVLCLRAQPRRFSSHAMMYCTMTQPLLLNMVITFSLPVFHIWR